MSESDLLKAMANAGIGTDATAGSHIEKIVERRYSIDSATYRL